MDRAWGLPGPPLFKCLLPALLPGTRCYTDAAIAPDNPLQVPRNAGLGIFIVDSHLQTTSTIYIKAVKKDCNSVIMAEAAALSLAAQILQALRAFQPYFLTDSQQLVTFFNGADHSNPPRWDIKPLTQAFSNIISENGGRIFKIDRKLNTTAHVLAHHAHQLYGTDLTAFQANCNNPHHVTSCPMMTAINYVLGDYFTLIAASCC